MCGGWRAVKIYCVVVSNKIMVGRCSVIVSILFSRVLLAPANFVVCVCLGTCIYQQDDEKHFLHFAFRNSVTCSNKMRCYREVL
jgi:hypothetical protein